MNKNRFLIVFFTLISILSFSQTTLVSPYSVYGIGTISDRSSALNRITGTGIGVRDPDNLNNYNPAAYTSIQHSTQLFEIGFYAGKSSYRTSAESEKLQTGNLTGINTWFRFSKKWAGVVGLSPYSSVNYNVVSTQRIGYDESSIVNFTGTGGITQVYFGNGFQLTPRLSIGATGSYLFGAINKTELIASGYGSGVTLKNKVTANRLNADFGAQYTFPLKKSKSFSFGITYTPKVRLNTNAERMLVTAAGDTTVHDEINIEDYTLPRIYGSGLSFQTRRSNIALDIRYKEWSKAVLQNDIALRNTTQFSASYRYMGNANGERYLDFVQFVAGMHGQTNYLVFEKDKSFNEWGLSAGIGLPVRGNLGTINLSYQYNKLGTVSSGLIEQQSSSIVIDIIFRDLWGIRRRFD